MGCAGSTSKETEHVEYNNIQPFDAEYPLPEEPKRSKDAVIDPSSDDAIETNIQRMPAGTESSYKSLLEYLSQGSRNEAHQVRAIYLWIAHAVTRPPDPEKERKRQKHKQEDPTGDTPEGYIRMMRENNSGHHTTLFTIMCRQSGIPCVMIDGIGKNIKYNIGSNHKMETRWTAVHVDEEWRLIHVGWSLTLRKQGKITESEFYFMTDPGEFVSFCHPEKNHWQLLNSPLTRKEFMNLPYITPKFFDLGMMIVSPTTAINRTGKGKAAVEVTLPKKQMDSVRISYKLTCISTPKDFDSDEESDRHKPVPARLERYVFMNRKSSRYIFEIQLPVRGKYFFDIFGMRIFKKDKHKSDVNDNDEERENADKMERLCQYKFICDIDPDEDIEPFPDSPDIGWGPGPVCKENGLVPLTHFDGHIYIKPGDLREVRFKNKADKEVQTTLVHNYLSSHELKTQVETEEYDDETTSVKVRIPEEGNYALKIFTRDEGEKEFKETCNYLLRQQVSAKVQEVWPYSSVMIKGDTAQQAYNYQPTSETPFEWRFAGGPTLVWNSMLAGIQRIISNAGEQKHISQMPIAWLSGPEFKKHRDKMIRTRLEYHTNHHTSERELKDALEMFDCYNVPDHGEKKRAIYKQKNYWEVKKELNSAIMGRNKGVLEKWVEKAKASKYRPDLEDEIQRAERVQGNMQKLKGYLHPIARMDPHTIHEIRTYNRPSPVVHNVMQSTYTLLGEKYDLDDWTYIQYLMGKPNKESLQHRILNRNPEDVTPEDAALADEYIKPHNLQQCREASTGTATFYRWNKQFIRQVKQSEMSDAEREADDYEIKDRETYRDYTESSHLGSRGSEHEPVVYKGRTNSRTSEEHPFGISEQTDRRLESQEKNRKLSDDKDDKKQYEQENNESTEDKKDAIDSFWMQPTRRADSPSERPISYAGFRQ